MARRSLSCVHADCDSILRRRRDCFALSERNLDGPGAMVAAAGRLADDVPVGGQRRPPTTRKRWHSFQMVHFYQRRTAASTAP